MLGKQVEIGHDRTLVSLYHITSGSVVDTSQRKSWQKSGQRGYNRYCPSDFIQHL